MIPNQPDTDNAAWFATAATEPPKPLSKAERIERATLDSYTATAWSLSMACGEFALRHELNPGSGIRIPLYIIPASLCPTPLTLSAGGYGCPHLVGVFQNVLERHFEWRGVGPALSVNNIQIYEMNRCRDSFAKAFVSICLHELCHTVAFAPFRLADYVDKEFVALIESKLAETSVMPRLQTDFVPWHSHSIPFLRAAIHIVDRINKSGLLKFKIDLSHVYPAEHYAMSPVEQYAAAFADEPARLARIPLSVLDAFDIPASAIQLFADDTARWRARHALKSASTVEPSRNPVMVVATKKEVTVFELVELEHARIRTEVEAQYARAVIDQADGENVDPVTCANLMRDLGFKAPQFKSDVKLLLRRRELVAMLASGASNEARRVAIANEQLVENARFGPELARHNAALWKLHNELTAINDEVVKCASAEDELRGTAPAASCGERIRLSEAHTQLAQSLHDLRHRQRTMVESCDWLQDAIRTAPSGFRRAGFCEQLEENQRGLGVITADVADLQAKIDAGMSRDAQLAAAMLVP